MASLNDIQTKIQAIIDIIKVKTTTGTLPLTFTATGGNVIDWIIEGNSGSVGERTKNLLKIGATSGTVNDVTFTVDKNTGIIVANSNGAASATTTILWQEKFSAGTYIFSAQLNGASDTYRMDISMQDWTFLAVNYTGENTITLTEDTTLRFRVVIFSGYVADSVVFKPMLRKSDTTADFIPYGYEIPLSISQQGETDKNYDIYIGDSPLTEGETVSKSSTGVDIELFEGSNTISTTLTNKPSMTIKYNKYINGGN